METKIKQIIVGTIAGATAIAGVVTGGGVTELNGKILTINQYNDVKYELINKYILNQQFNLNEFLDFTAVLDREVKTRNLKEFSGEITDKNMLNKLVNKIIE